MTKKKSETTKKADSPRKAESPKKAAAAKKAPAPKKPVVEAAPPEPGPVPVEAEAEPQPLEEKILREEEIRKQEVVIIPEEFTCHLCGVKQIEPLLAGQFCAICHDHVQQAYQWLQSPMLTASEYKSLQKKIMDLTDVKNVKLE